MTDDRSEFERNRAAGKARQHEQRLARATVCKNCGKPIKPVDWSNGPGWIHEGTERSVCQHLRATPLIEETL